MSGLRSQAAGSEGPAAEIFSGRIAVTIEEIVQRQLTIKNYIDGLQEPEPVTGLCYWLSELALQMAIQNQIALRNLLPAAAQTTQPSTPTKRRTRTKAL